MEHRSDYRIAATDSAAGKIVVGDILSNDNFDATKRLSEIRSRNLAVPALNDVPRVLHIM